MHFFFWARGDPKATCAPRRTRRIYLRGQRGPLGNIRSKARTAHLFPGPEGTPRQHTPHGTFNFCGLWATYAPRHIHFGGQRRPLGDIRPKAHSFMGPEETYTRQHTPHGAFYFRGLWATCSPRRIHFRGPRGPICNIRSTAHAFLVPKETPRHYTPNGAFISGARGTKGFCTKLCSELKS